MGCVLLSSVSESVECVYFSSCGCVALHGIFWILVVPSDIVGFFVYTVAVVFI